MHVSNKYFLQGSSSMSWYATFLSLLQLAPCCADEVRWVIMLHELFPDATATTTSTNNHPSMQIDAAPTVSS